MPNIGPLELAIVLIIALVIFGPSRLPELGKSLGKGMREFKSSIAGESDDEDDEDDEDDPPEIDNGVEEELPESADVDADTETEPAGQPRA